MACHVLAEARWDTAPDSVVDDFDAALAEELPKAKVSRASSSTSGGKPLAAASANAEKLAASTPQPEARYPAPVAPLSSPSRGQLGQRTLWSYDDRAQGAPDSGDRWSRPEVPVSQTGTNIDEEKVGDLVAAISAAR
jgi:hypothetical protein